MQIFDPTSPEALIVLKKSDLIQFADYLLNSRKDTQDRAKPGDEWLTAKEISQRFGIAYNNVKSAKWRESHGFPSHQPGGAYSTPMFCAAEVSVWLMNE